MQIRIATISDSLAIATLHAASWRNAYRDALSDKYLASDVVSDRRQLWESRLTEPTERQHVLLAEDDEQLLGFACVYVDEDSQWGSYLNNIHVAQTAQGKGVGRLLLHATAEICGGSNSEKLYLWVLQSNTNAQGFYSRYDCKNTGTDIWEAPGGTTAPLFRFSWDSVFRLHEVTANPSFQRTAFGSR